MPRLIRERWDAEIGAGIIVGRAQCPHPREGNPGPFPAISGFIDNNDIVDLITLQGMGARDTALPAADDQHIVYRRAIQMMPYRQPFKFRMLDRLQISADLTFQSLQARVDHIVRSDVDLCGSKHVVLWLRLNTRYFNRTPKRRIPLQCRHHLRREKTHVQLAVLMRHTAI